MTSEVTGPVLQWYGGKWNIAPWIISQFPFHSVYVEPFAGAASVLLRKPRSPVEIYNDLNSDVVNLFAVLRDAQAADELMRLLELTPFARDEYFLSHEESATSIERARRVVVRSFMGFTGDGGAGKNQAHRTFRARKGEISSFAQTWAAYPQRLPAFVSRLKGVVIENRDALDCMLQHDSPTTLHYVDPPYRPDVRRSRRGYKHELTADDHAKLLECLCQLKGMVVLSGYHSEVYDAGLPGWRREEKLTYDNCAQSRTEVLWINPAAVAARDQNLQSRFALIKP